MRTVLVAHNEDLCPGIVTRDGVEEPCEKPTTCIIDDPEAGLWAACTWHAHRYGNGRVVTLRTIRGDLFAVVDTERDALLAKFEALADRWADDAGIEGYINLGEAEDAVRAVIAEARS